MKYEKSCGVIPFYYKDKKLHVVLIKQTNGVVGFPKGHMEKGESEIETALRECHEETKAKPSIIDGFKEEISYYISEIDVYKTVVFFVGILSDLSLEKQDSEISDIYIVPIKDAIRMIPFPDTRAILRKAQRFIKNKKEQ